jgi:hypothetical protein
MSAWDRFWFAVALCVTLTSVLEGARRLPKYKLPWWVTHGPAIAWAGVALIPWLIALRRGYWPVPAGPGDTVPLSLPATYEYTLLALVGLTIGITPFTIAGRERIATASVPPAEIRPVRASITVAILCITYVISCGFSLSRLWVLSNHAGADVYSNSADSSFLTLSLVIVAGLALTYLTRRQSPSKLGLLLYLSLVVVALGSAHRYLVMILVLAYIIVSKPFRAVRHGTFSHRVLFFVMIAGAIWLVGFSGLGKLSALRSGASLPASYIYNNTLSSFDVMGSAEYLLEAGGKPGQLRGASYLALPNELIPHALIGSRASPPTSAAQSAIFGNIGASAPLWIEGVLNFGAYGDIISMSIIGLLWGAAFRWATSSRSQIAITAAAIGPAWILFLYQALSRILILAAIDLFGSMIIAIILWNWIQSNTNHAPASYLGRPAQASQQPALTDG